MSLPGDSDIDLLTLRVSLVTGAEFHCQLLILIMYFTFSVTISLCCRTFLFLAFLFFKEKKSRYCDYRGVSNVSGSSVGILVCMQKKPNVV